MSPNAGGGEGEVAAPQPISTAVHITSHGAQIDFGDLTPYVTYAPILGLYEQCHIVDREASLLKLQLPAYTIW
jgi:hypothetical protein